METETYHPNGEDYATRMASPDPVDGREGVHLAPSEQPRPTDADMKRIMDWTREVVDTFVPLLGLWEWNIDIDFHRGLLPDGEETAAAVATVQPQYLQGRIRISAYRTYDLDYAGMRALVVHEMSHFISEEIYLHLPENDPSRSNLREALTSRIARAAIRAFLAAPPATSPA